MWSLAGCGWCGGGGDEEEIEEGGEDDGGQEELHAGVKKGRNVGFVCYCKNVYIRIFRQEKCRYFLCCRRIQKE